MSDSGTPTPGKARHNPKQDGGTYLWLLIFTKVMLVETWEERLFSQVKVSLQRALGGAALLQGMQFKSNTPTCPTYLCTRTPLGGEMLQDEVHGRGAAPPLDFEEGIAGNIPVGPCNATHWWLVPPCTSVVSCTRWAPAHTCCPQAVPFFSAMIFLIRETS